MTMISTFYHTFSKDENYKNNPNNKVDEAEASSILVSMANQTNQRSRPIHSTMSIHNLLDLDESKKEYKISLMVRGIKMIHKEAQMMNRIQEKSNTRVHPTVILHYLRINLMDTVSGKSANK